MKAIQISLLCIILICSKAFAGDELTEKKVPVKTTYRGSSKKLKYLNANATITMADGSTKAISQVLPGETIRICKNGHTGITTVNRVMHYDAPISALTTIYLRPSDDNRRIVEAVLLEATPHHKVRTTHGWKKMKKLSKKDILYRYDSENEKLSTWQIGAIKKNSQRVKEAYDLETSHGTFMANSMIVAGN